MSAETHSTTDAAHHDHHITPTGTFVAVFAALVILMVLTILAARVDMAQPWNNVIAMTIAIVKATLVILFFMGVKYSSKLVQVYAILGFLWFTTILIGFCDYFTRSWEPIRGFTKEQPSALNRERMPPLPPGSELKH